MSLRSLLAHARRGLDFRWPALWGLCFATAAALDRAWVAPFGVGVLWAFAAGAGAGLCVGALTGGLARALAGRVTWVALLPWCALSLLAALALGRDLGVAARFDGPYRTLAIAATLGCAAMAAFGGALAFCLQPTRTQSSGWLLARTPRVRLAVAVALLAAAGGCIALDRTFETSAYPLAHDALRWTSLGSLVSATWVLTGSRMARPWAANAGLWVAFLSAFTLSARHTTELARLEQRPYASLGLRVIQALSDFDWDGYSTFFGGGDCRPFDPNVNPGQQEVPDNGIDDNCRRGDARARTAPPSDFPVPQEPSPTSVVLITVDTLSAPRMSLYGAKRPTTPRLEKWAEGAVVFDRAYSSGGWTSLAIPSLMRGVYPRRLAWTRLIETNRFSLLRVNEPAAPGERMKTSFGLPLEDPHRPLAYWLQRRGMFTAAVANDRQSEFLDPRFQGEGFDRFVDLDEVAGAEANDTDVTDAALAVLREMPTDRRFFLWVHYFGPHKPDERHDSVPHFGNGRGARYDHEVAFADREVSRLLDALESDPRGQGATYVVTADHGEQFRGDWRGHGGDVHEATIHIPLLLKTPRLVPARVRAPVSLVDVFPTLLAVTGTPGPEGDGFDLRRVARGETQSRVLISETWRFNARGVIINDRLAAFDGKYKLERDNLRDVTAFVEQKPSQKPLPERKHPKQRERLRDALETYLEENGAIQMKD